jgi:hypothetical protein
MPGAWNDWYHCTTNAYGTWLRGSDLGYRERHHRQHVEGDYKNPPPPGKYSDVKQQSKALMKRPPVRLSPDDQKLALNGIIASFEKDAIRLIALAVDAIHLHALFCCPDHDPRHWLGRAKGRVARQLLDAGRADGRVWGRRCGVHPIADRGHQVTVFYYILRHADRGARVWRC